MPFRSAAQRRKFYATPSLRKYIPEFEAAIGDGKLPEHVRKRKRLARALAHHHPRKHKKGH